MITTSCVFFKNITQDVVAFWNVVWSQQAARKKREGDYSVGNRTQATKQLHAHQCGEINCEGGMDTMQTLRESKPGSTVHITRVGGAGPVKRRIMEMGLTKGAEVFVRRVAPLGDPVEVMVRGYELSLRKADAEFIEVE
jgi:ferrous iron transport protein A